MRAVFLCLAMMLGLFPALAEAVRVSDWVEFREARVRLLLLEPQPGETVLRGGIGIRLMPDYKTYWRSPGDSGVPPLADIGGSTGVSGFELLFPFPSRFDDGAGGQAWGYKRDVILPFTLRREANAPLDLRMKLDFAVCGTMCIPLAAELRLAGGQPGSADVVAALRRAHENLPRRLEPADAAKLIAIRRLPSDGKALFELDIHHEATLTDFSLFPEAKGYFHVDEASQKAPGLFSVKLKGRPAPGTGGKFGPVRLTFGSKKQPLEAMIDLDGLNPSP